MRNHARTISFVSIAGFLALLAFASTAFLFNTIRTLSLEAGRDREGIESDTRREQLLRSLSRTYDDTVDERMRLRSLFVQAGSAADFIGYVEGLARKTGVELEVGSVEVMPASTRGDLLEELALTVRAEGTWAAVMRFERALESAPYGIAIKRSAFEREAGTRPLWSSTAAFSVFALKKP